MKPTPLQARLLRFLAKWPATQVSYSPNSFNAPSKLLTFRSELPYHEWHAQHEVWAQEKNAEGIDRVRVATLQAMERGELLQRVDGRSWEVDLIPTEWARQVVQLMGPEEFVDPPARPRTEVIETRMMLDALRQRYQSDAGWT